MKSEQSRPVMPTVICLAWIGSDDPTTTNNPATERNDRTRGGKELQAFVDSGAVDNVLPKSVCTEYPLELVGERVTHQALWAATSSSQDKRWK